MQLERAALSSVRLSFSPRFQRDFLRRFTVCDVEQVGFWDVPSLATDLRSYHGACQRGYEANMSRFDIRFDNETSALMTRLEALSADLFVGTGVAPDARNGQAAMLQASRAAVWQPDSGLSAKRYVNCTHVEVIHQVADVAARLGANTQCSTLDWEAISCSRCVYEAAAAAETGTPAEAFRSAQLNISVLLCLSTFEADAVGDTFIQLQYALAVPATPLPLWIDPSFIREQYNALGPSTGLLLDGTLWSTVLRPQQLTLYRRVQPPCAITERHRGHVACPPNGAAVSGSTGC